MNNEYLVHITAAGDRWDLLANRYYGDAVRYAPLIAANPHIPILPLLPGGLMMAIPVLEDSDSIPSEELPPWKR